MSACLCVTWATPPPRDCRRGGQVTHEGRPPPPEDGWQPTWPRVHCGAQVPAGRGVAAGTPGLGRGLQHRLRTQKHSAGSLGDCFFNPKGLRGANPCRPPPAAPTPPVTVSPSRRWLLRLPGDNSVFGIGDDAPSLKEVSRSESDGKMCPDPRGALCPALCSPRWAQLGAVRWGTCAPGQTQ